MGTFKENLYVKLTWIPLKVIISGILNPKPLVKIGNVKYYQILVINIFGNITIFGILFLDTNPNVWID